MRRVATLIRLEPHMPLPWREKLATLLPPATFYRRRIAQEARAGEPELAVLDKLVRRGGTAVDRVALADKPGRGSFYVPHADDGMVLHLAGSLKRAHAQFRTVEIYEVEIATLDAFGFADVRFIKADVEGSEREVLEGARATIARERPVLLLELLSGTHPDPGALTAEICASFRYDAFLVQRGQKIAALPAIAALGKNMSWGTNIESRNVLFVPRN